MAYTRQQFIDKLAPLAVRCMHETDISAALTIAQGCLESANGNSGLVTQANNLFGHKGSGDAGTINMPTKEQRKDGSEYTINAFFSKFSSWQASVDAKAQLLLNGVSWNRNLYRPVIGKRGKEAARQIQACGYATDVNYANKLIAIMDQYNLYKYDAQEVEDEMTSAEKAAFEALQNTVAGMVKTNDAQTDRIKQLETRLQEVPPPTWAKAAAEYYAPYFGQQTGTNDFWRCLVIQHNKDMGGNK